MVLTIQTKPLSKYLYMVLFRFGTDFAKWNFGSNVLELLLIVTLETLNSVKPILKPACDQVVFGTMKKNKFKAACVRNHIFCLLCFFFVFRPFEFVSCLSSSLEFPYLMTVPKKESPLPLYDHYRKLIVVIILNSFYK